MLTGNRPSSFRRNVEASKAVSNSRLSTLSHQPSPLTVIRVFRFGNKYHQYTETQCKISPSGCRAHQLNTATTHSFDQHNRQRLERVRVKHRPHPGPLSLTRHLSHIRSNAESISDFISSWHSIEGHRYKSMATATASGSPSLVPSLPSKPHFNILTAQQ